MAVSRACRGRQRVRCRCLTREVRIDGEVQRSAGALAGHVRMLWLTPAMDRLFAGPASDRRRYLDRLTAVFDVSHGTRVNALERLLRERNRLLSEDRLDRPAGSTASRPGWPRRRWP
jgi:recombinational DNA repair ATPase RecF